MYPEPAIYIHTLLFLLVEVRGFITFSVELLSFCCTGMSTSPLVRLRATGLLFRRRTGAELATPEPSEALFGADLTV